MQAYSFPMKPGETDYEVFPASLEVDPNVFFHGTAEANLASILKNGFALPEAPLAPSVSFAMTSALSLGYASKARNISSPEGCIIVVRYADLNRKGLAKETSMLHDYTLLPPPEIIGYCIVPSGYIHM